MNTFRQTSIKISICLAIIFVLFSVAITTNTTHAQTSTPQPKGPITYVPLVDDLPGVETREANDISLYLQAIFKLLIGVAAALAVIMITVGGIQYMSTDAIGGKHEGKEKINHALMGLILAISAWLILYTINPDTLNFNFDPDDISSGEQTVEPTPLNGTWHKIVYCFNPVPGIPEQKRLTWERVGGIAFYGSELRKTEALAECNALNPRNPGGPGDLPRTESCRLGRRTNCTTEQPTWTTVDEWM